MARPSAKPIRPAYQPDADEAEALAAAAATLSSLARVENAEAIASAVISRWIIERMKRSVGVRLIDNVVFDLKDAKLRGLVEAMLPQIAASLMADSFPMGLAFGDLPKHEAVTLFAAGYAACHEAQTAADEASGFAFSDPIPFGAVSA